MYFPKPSLFQGIYIKLHMVVRLQFRGMNSILLLLLPSPLRTEVVVPVRVLFMDFVPLPQKQLLRNINKKYKYECIVNAIP